MQVNVNQDAAVRQYTQAMQNTGTAATSSKAVADTTEEASKKKEQDTDKVEFSKDTNVTTKMSDSERAALVKSLKDDLNNQMSRFTNMMVQTFQKQGITSSMIQGDDFWKMMASGKYSVDAQTKADAQEAISEDGYWGVKQTSQRIFDFAHALAGDDVEKMQKFQKAVEKGFEQAGAQWGTSLPSICQDTHAEINKRFDYWEQNGSVDGYVYAAAGK